VWLRYAPRRVQCRRCGVGTERVAWAGSTTSRFTAALEELGAYLATVMDQTAVTRLLGISWAAVGEIVERVVARKLDPKRLDGIRRIGVDEFSYRKRHRYLTLVVDHDRQRVVFAHLRRFWWASEVSAKATIPTGDPWAGHRAGGWELPRLPCNA